MTRPPVCDRRPSWRASYESKCKRWMARRQGGHQLFLPSMTAHPYSQPFIHRGWRCFTLALVVTFSSTTQANPVARSPDAAITRLADAFVAEYQIRFPSVTPGAVADLGMQVMGWDIDKAAAYLQTEMPFWTSQRAREVAGSLGPGDVESYPVGVLQYQAARQRAEQALGSGFDSREFHQMLLSDGALPFVALNLKIDRWIAARR